MQAYFTDEFNFDNEWQYTHIQIKDKITPFYQLYTGGQHQRFILSSPKNTLYFGFAKRYCAGAVIVRVDSHIEHEDMPLPAITSADVEKFKQLNPKNLYQYWANFYAKALLNSTTTFIKQGSWRILPTITHEVKKKIIADFNKEFYQDYLNRLNNIPLQKFSSIQAFSNYITLNDIKWGVMASDNEIFLMNPLPDLDNGRVKFWRKKIQENACPPLLVWYQPHLHAYLLVDGHARFQAHFLENSEPNILAIEQFFRQTYAIDETAREKERQKVFEGLEKSFEKSRKPLAIDSLNGILLPLYDDYSHDRQTLMAKPIANLDELWQSHLHQMIADGRLSQKQLEFLNNEEN